MVNSYLIRQPTNLLFCLLAFASVAQPTNPFLQMIAILLGFFANTDKKPWHYWEYWGQKGTREKRWDNDGSDAP